VSESSFFDEVGGHATFDKLTRSFYDGVASDVVLRPMYPEEDLEPARVRLQLFLEQYWGGPTEYSDTRGHPRLRMRHMPFHINAEARERWLVHMTAAIASLQLAPLHEEAMLDYVDRAAHAMTNQPD
jgi:hemoglobin